MVDPNVLISAAVARFGPPRRILDHWLYGRFEMVVSYDLLYELEAVLLRNRFREKLSVSDVLDYVRYLADRGTMAHPPEPHARVAEIPDPDDHYLVNLAEFAAADRLVSGDPDLGATTPREFLDELEQGL